MNIRTTIVCALVLPAPFLGTRAQEKTQSGYTMIWSHDLTERTGSVTVNRLPLQGLSFMVYECSSRDALGYWKDHMGNLGGAVKGNKPVRVTGASIPGVTSPVPIVLGQVEKDRDADGVRITVVFAVHDSATIPEEPGMAEAVHQMAVAVNRMVVQAQVADQEKALMKISGKLADAQKDEQKATKRASSASRDLEKVNTKQEKIARKRANLQRELEGLQQRYAVRSDPKILEKIARAQQKLADVEQDAAKAQQQEGDAQEHVNKHQDQVPEARKEQHEHEEQKDRANRELEALKRKLEAIR